MDHSTFQSELAELKQRVSQMALAYKPSPLASSRVLSNESGNDITQSFSPAPPAELPPLYPPALPFEPLLDPRISLQGLTAPSRWAPTMQSSSSYVHNGHQVLACPQLRAVSNDRFSTQLGDIKARVADMQHRFQDTPWRSQDHWSYSQALHQNDLPYSAGTGPSSNAKLSLPSGPLFWQLFDSLRTDVQSLDSRVFDLEQKFSILEDRFDALSPRFTPPSSVGSDVSHCEDLERSRKFSFAFTQPGINTDQSNSAAVTEPPASERVPRVLSELESRESNAPHPATEGGNFTADLDFGHRLASANGAPAPEGVAFRDKEITQLEELLRVSQESLAQKDAETDELRALCHEFNSELSRLRLDRLETDKDASAFRELLISRNAEIEKTRAASFSSDKAWEAECNALQQSYACKKTHLAHAEREVQELRRTVQYWEREYDSALEHEDSETRKLRKLCDELTNKLDCHGQAALKKQEEFDLVSQELAAMDSRLESETRQRAKCENLLEQREEEIAKLKVTLRHALTPTQYRSSSAASTKRRSSGRIDGHGYGGYDVDNDQSSVSPFATAGVQIGPVRGPEDRQWTPRALANRHAMLPHEQQRAYGWKIGPSSGRHMFGVPSSLGSSGQKHAGPDAARSAKEVERRNDTIKLISKLGLGETPAAPPLPPRRQSVSSSADNASGVPSTDPSSAVSHQQQELR